MKKILLVLASAVMLGANSCWPGKNVAFAQTAAPANAPALSSTEGIAIAAVAEKLQANQKERENLTAALRRVEADIAAAHHGYHFDEATGTLVKDPAPAEKK